MIGSAGKVTIVTPGTLVAAVVNMPASPPARPTSCHGVMFQALSTNVGKVYIGQLGLNRTTLANVFAVLAIPTTNILPSFSAALTITPNGLSLNQFYIDADEAADGVLVTYLIT